MSRILGLDVGRERIGLALSDPEGLIAQAWQTVYVKRRSIQVIAQEIIDLCESNQIQTLVFGWPLRLNGKEGIQTRYVQRLIDQVILLHSGFHIERWDERLSTVAAQRVLSEGSVKHKQRKAVIDQVAACLILQGWLDCHQSSH